MEKLEAKIVDLLDRAEELGINLGPEAFDALVRAERWDGAVPIALGMVFWFGGLMFFLGAGKAADKKESKFDDLVIPAVLWSTAFGVGGFILC